jgi:hypothetical protein
LRPSKSFVREGSAIGKRKRPQNNGFTEPGLQATDVSALDKSATKEVQSLANIPAVHPHNSYWTSLEAKYCIRPIEEEKI